MEYPIIIWPSQYLSEPAKTFEWSEGQKDLDYLDKLKTVMATAMLKANGIGLAAPQIGESIRVCVVIDRDDPERKIQTFINPDIVEHHTEVDSLQERCLSLPGEEFDVVRFKYIRMKYQDENGNKKELLANGFYAIELQHEVDHLNGKLLIDSIGSPLFRSSIRDRMLKLKKKQKRRGDTWKNLDELGAKLLARPALHL